MRVGQGVHFSFLPPPFSPLSPPFSLISRPLSSKTKVYRKLVLTEINKMCFFFMARPFLIFSQDTCSIVFFLLQEP